MMQSNDQETPENINEYLRLTLPMMSKHHIPPTPQNYAVWYRHVKGANNELSDEIERIKNTNQKFTDQLNNELYQKYVADESTECLEQTRTEMSDILRDVGESLNAAGIDAKQYGGTLNSTIGGVQNANNLSDIKGLLETLVAATKQIEKSTSQMEKHFSSKSREVELLHEELQRERKRATTDPLTSLANRVALFDNLNESIDNIVGEQTPAMLMIDIDHFKRVNDSYGHLIGDRVIRFVAQILQQNTKGKDTAARFGGEEFAVLLPNTEIKGAEKLAEIIRQSIAEAQLVRSDTKEPLGQVTVSIGISKYRVNEDPMELINRADQALYLSKHNGRNRISNEDQLSGDEISNQSLH